MSEESRYTYIAGTTPYVEEGEYNFIVAKATEKESEKGNAMIELQLQIETDDDDGLLVFDYLVFTRRLYAHIDDFWESTGDVIKKGEKVTLEAEDCQDRRGRVRLYVEEYQDKLSNKVKKYLKPGSGSLKDSSQPF